MGQGHGRQLREAIERNSLREVKRVLDSHPKCINETDANGNTAVILAVRNGRIEILRELVQRKANVNSSNVDNETALHFAARHQNDEYVKLLLTSGANPNTRGLKPVEVACIWGSFDVFRAFFDIANVGVNQRISLNSTLLLAAVDKGFCDKIEFLIGRGADVDAVDDKRSTPLMVALNKWTQRMSCSHWDRAPKIRQWIFELAKVNLSEYMYLAVAAYLIADCRANLARQDGQGRNAINYFCAHLNEIRSPVEKGAAMEWFNNLIDRQRRPSMFSRISSFIFKYIGSSKSRRKTDTPSAPVAGPPTAACASEEPEKVDTCREAREDIWLCVACRDNIINVKFYPCGHRVACEVCSRSMEQCVSCNEPVARRKRCNPNGDEFDDITGESSRSRETVILPVRSAPPVPLAPPAGNPLECVICMERQRDVTFAPCGHGTCRVCADLLQQCHACRCDIVQKLTMYL